MRTGALDVDYLRPKKQPPSDGLGRGRVTEYEVLCDAIKSELLSIDDKGAGAQNASLDFGEFLEFVSVSVLGLRSDAVFMKTSTRCRRRDAVDAAVRESTRRCALHEDVDAAARVYAPRE